MPDPTSRLIVALDVPTLSEATDLARRLAPHLAGVKIGSQLFTAEGPRAVHAMHDLGLRVFLDLKFHDIPNTVGGAVAAATSLGVWMLNVHASGGPAMMAAAATGAGGRTLVLGVTVPTSVEEKDLQATLGELQPTVSRHLAILRRAGIVRARRARNRVVYDLSDPRIASLLEQVDAFVGST